MIEKKYVFSINNSQLQRSTYTRVVFDSWLLGLTMLSSCKPCLATSVFFADLYTLCY